METLRFGRNVLGVGGLAVVLLAGCDGAQNSTVPSGAGALSRTHKAAGSWMLPGAKNENLLYISDFDGPYTAVFSYPKGKFTGILIVGGNGLCVDKKGDVFITSDQNIIEYAHGGKNPIATLSDPGSYAEDCSVDPTTGNLAVTNSTGSSRGNVAVYKKASGTPTIYTDSGIYYYQDCGYDGDGNLFIDGITGGTPYVGFAELPKGGNTFTNIGLKKSIGEPGGIQWDGKYMAVGDQGGDIYRYTISGGKATLKGATKLYGEGWIRQFWIEGSKVIGPNLNGSDAMFWYYPHGGEPFKTITKHLQRPFGVTISLKQ